MVQLRRLRARKLTTSLRGVELTAGRFMPQKLCSSQKCDISRTAGRLTTFQCSISFSRTRPIDSRRYEGPGSPGHVELRRRGVSCRRVIPELCSSKKCDISGTAGRLTTFERSISFSKTRPFDRLRYRGSSGRRTTVARSFYVAE